MRKIDNKDKVDKETIEIYDNINGFDVMRELFLFKGEDRVCREMRVEFRDLLDAAFILYGLKQNSTNKLYVSFHLTRFYKKEGLITPNGRIIAPVSLYDEVKAVNDKYRSTTPPSLR